MQRYAENALWQKYGKGVAYAYVEQNLMKLMQIVALVEFSLGFLVIFDLFSGLGRGLSRAFMYWHWLKLKYKFEQFKYGGGAGNNSYQMYHTQVWRQIDQAVVVPAVARFPMLQRGIDVATGWFNK